MREIVAFTTIRQGNNFNEIEKVRSEVFLDTSKALYDLGIPCVAVSIDCDSSYQEAIKQFGVITLPQTTKGMGNVRREALQAALDLFSEASYFFWLEPEKPQIPRFVKPMLDLMKKKKAFLGLFNRINLDSYPKEQAYYYLFCKTVATKLLSINLDYAFGPMILSKNAVHYFLRYESKYGDKWDSILILRLRVIKDNHPIALLPIDFKNDPRMTRLESGNPQAILKRIDQFNNVISSLIKELENYKPPRI